MRGSIRVRESSGAPAEIVLGFPDMFNEPAHEKVIPLTEVDLQRLVVSEMNRGYEFTLTGAAGRTVPSE